MSDIPYAYITRLVVKNYRSLQDVDIALNNLTVFVGQNGTGKSNVIDVLRFVRDALADGFERALFKRGGMKALRCWFASEHEDVSIQLHFEGAEWSGAYEFAFGNSTGDQVEIKSEKLSLPAPLFEVVDGQLMQIPLTIDGILMRNPNDQKPKQLSKRSFYLSQLGLVVPSIQAVRDFLINMSFYDLLPTYMRNPQKATLPVLLLEDGRNLASVLHEIQQGKKDYLITQALEVAIKGIEGYSIMPVGQHLVTKLHYAFPGGDLRKAVSDLTDEASGTIRLLATLAALYQERFPSPLVIEEPEKEIYPDALELLSDMLEVATDRYQVIISTHSPDLITYLPAKSLRVVDKVLGITKIGPISKEQYDTIAENIFSAGALMRSSGLERKKETISE